MNIIDTRDLFEEMEALNERQQDEDQIDPLDEFEEARLAALVELFNEIGEEIGRFGESMILESDFEEYAEELASDLGFIGSSTQSWPFNRIDWEAAANDLKIDYTEVTFDGDDYLIRAS